MSEHTKEPWSFYDDRSSTGRIEIVGLGKTVARIYLSVPSEDFDNARRIVACVNACVGIDINYLETLVRESSSIHHEMMQRIQNKIAADRARSAIASVKGGEA